MYSCIRIERLNNRPDFPLLKKDLDFPSLPETLDVLCDVLVCSVLGQVGILFSRTNWPLNITVEFSERGSLEIDFQQVLRPDFLMEKHTRSVWLQHAKQWAFDLSSAQEQESILISLKLVSTKL